MNQRISHTQLTALIWAAMLAPAAELLPAITLPAGGKGAWLAPVAAIPLVLLSGELLGRLSREGGLARGLCHRLGPVLGGGTLLIYMVWALVLLALRLRLCAQRLLSTGYRDGALWYFLLAVAAVALWLGVGHLPALARTGQIFLAILLVTGGIVLLLSLGRVRPERVLPLWLEDVGPVLVSGLPAAGALGWGIWGAFLAGQLKPAEGRGRWYGRFWGAGGCLLLALAQWVVLGNLGPALAGRLDDPFFALAKSVGIEGAFQRVESVIVAVWTLADLILAALLLFSLRKGAECVPLFKERDRQTAATALLLAVVLALGLFSRERAVRWSREVVPWVNLLLALGIPVAVNLLGAILGKGEERADVVVKKGGKVADIVVEKDVEKKGEKSKKRC